MVLLSNRKPLNEHRAAFQKKPTEQNLLKYPGKIYALAFQFQSNESSQRNYVFLPPASSSDLTFQNKKICDV